LKNEFRFKNMKTRYKNNMFNGLISTFNNSTINVRHTEIKCLNKFTLRKLV